MVGGNKTTGDIIHGNKIVYTNTPPPAPPPPGKSDVGEATSNENASRLSERLILVAILAIIIGVIYIIFMTGRTSIVEPDGPDVMSIMGTLEAQSTKISDLQKVRATTQGVEIPRTQTPQLAQGTEVASSLQATVDAQASAISSLRATVTAFPTALEMARRGIATEIAGTAFQATSFVPRFPDAWPDGIKLIPAKVVPRQQYWHLKFALFCDWAPDDQHQTCDGWPGGGMGTSIYVMTVDESGACITTAVNDDINDGSKYPLNPDALKKIEYSWNPYGFGCDQNYEKGMYGEGNNISVPGLPSDKITDLSLCAKNPPPGYNPPPCGYAHVRYFLIFQRTTR